MLVECLGGGAPARPSRWTQPHRCSAPRPTTNRRCSDPPVCCAKDAANATDSTSPCAVSARPPPHRHGPGQRASRLGLLPHDPVDLRPRRSRGRCRRCLLRRARRRAARRVQLRAAPQPPYFVIIDRALRDEGTSHHHLPPSDWAHAAAALLDSVTSISGLAEPVVVGATWTTDALTAKPPPRSPAPKLLALSPSRWMSPPSTRTPPPDTAPCSVSYTSPTRWPPMATTSKG